MTTLQSRLLWIGWKLQRETATCDTPWLYWENKRKKERNIGSLSLFRRGPGVVIRISFPAKLYQLISDLSPFCYDTSVLIFVLVLKTFLCLERDGKLPLASDQYNPCIVSSMWRRRASNIIVFEILVILACPRCSGSGGAWWMVCAGGHNLCAPLMVKYKPKVWSLFAS